MRVDNKEKIFVELRQHHVIEIPEKLSTAYLNESLAEFIALQDKVVTMLIGFTDRKIEFIDFSAEIKSLRGKMQPNKKGEALENRERALFLSKINSLLALVEFAKDFYFPLKPSKTSS
jgi:hypothetical protein